MLWSKPTILYDTILDYRIEDHVSLTKYWQIKNDPTLSAMRLGHKVCLVTTPKIIDQTSILWQHVFLDPLLQNMQTGWHLCLLPRHMVVVIKDGLYVCERLMPEKEEQIESTKAYMYRFGYEPDMPLQTHDWRQTSETVTVPPHYKGFVLQPYRPWYKKAQDVGRTFFRFFAPHTTNIFGATLIGLVLGSLYYGYQNDTHDWDRIRVLQAWPTIQSSKARADQLLELVGLLDEAKAPASLVKSIAMDNKGLSIQCDEKFTSDHNVEALKQFLKKYCPCQGAGFSGVTDSSASRVEPVSTGIQEKLLDPGSQETLEQQSCQVFHKVREISPWAVTVKVSNTSSILLEKPHSLSYQANTRHKC